MRRFGLIREKYARPPVVGLCLTLPAKVYVKDTKSSNGTYVNDERLSQSGMESEPRELKTGS